MADKREQILTRLHEILEEQKPDAKTVARNEVLTDDDHKPALLLLDADEEADDNDPRGRPAYAPRRVRLFPEMYVAVQAKPEEVGQVLNQWRARLVKAILTDTLLKDLAGANGDIRYEGCGTALAGGRSMQGEMKLVISVAYILRAQDL